MQDRLSRNSLDSEKGHWAVSAANLTRRFGQVAALNGISIQIGKGEFFSLLGPSGCGKTTLLRLIAGLDFPDAGTLIVGGRDVSEWPAYQRPVNTVFQSYALFPHLSVRENIAFGLKMKRTPETEMKQRVERVLASMQIVELAERRPHQISGGQKQRVALARALVNEPDILLLDEPLGALDLKLRKQLQVELHQLQRKLGITFIYVTHDQDEALTMSDRIAVMNHGCIEQIGTPESLYERPRNRFVAQFLGSCNLLEGRFCGTTDGMQLFETALGKVRLKAKGTAPDPVKTTTLAIRPEKICLSGATDAEQLNQFPVKVREVVYSGAETHYYLQANGTEFRTAVFNAANHIQFSRGENITMRLPAESLILLDD